VTRLVAFVRAVNVGGTGKLPMAELKAMCDRLGLRNARTYLASGNVVFDTDLAANEVRRRLAGEISGYLGQSRDVILRTAPELCALIEGNPFKAAPGNKLNVWLWNDPIAPDSAARATGARDEELISGPREIYVHYPTGMGTSKLKLPGGETGTARNMNTVAAMFDLTMNGG